KDRVAQGYRRGLVLGAALVALGGCQKPASETAEAVDGGRDSTPIPVVATPNAATLLPGNGSRQAYFGDLHVHTRLSFDAYIFGTRSTPDSAYRFAKGESLAHPSGFDMQLDRPLDFLGVTDHAMYMGMLEEMSDPESAAGKHPVALKIREAATPAARILAFQGMFPYLRQQLDGPDDLLDGTVLSSAWDQTVAAAQAHNDPGTFTTFIAYEYTAGGDDRENLHRNVVFRGAAPEAPFSSMDSRNPEDLWDWLDEQRRAGIEGLAIPHNSNGSDGLMFELTQRDGSPMDLGYARQRLRNEPLVEITQVKGTSDTHPLLSPNDEWADFELMEVKVATVLPSKPQGSYVREALRHGLMLEAELGANPYDFGLIGSSDTHVGAGSFDESGYWSKVGIVDGTPVQRGSVPLDEPDADGSRYATAGVGGFADWGASGLAGVWAEANSREALYDAMRRKETFATSGPRIRVRFFGGYGLDPELLSSVNPAPALYASAVRMGGTMETSTRAPSFFVEALRDSGSAPLERLQIVKGGLNDDGTTFERVYDVACAGGAPPDRATQRCANASTQPDAATCAFDENAGDAALRTLWTDPDHRVGERAFYYLRALEIPTCRWSTWDALRAGVAPREDLAPTIQERAWSSPIQLVN
ncbi:MAG: DUF3604 domain-containing protein, partial [Pseudomonadota bacterium]